MSGAMYPTGGLAERVRSHPGRRGGLARWLAVLVLVLVVPFAASCASAEDAAPGAAAGQLLVASRQMTDPHFARTIVYVVAHDSNGAFGLVVNRRYGEESLQALFDAFGITAPPSMAAVPLHYGGPVQPERGFILHSRDYDGESTIRLNDWLAFSTGRDVLEAMAAGKGPKRALLILGYAGWGPDQLDGEIARGDWLLAPAEPSLIFEDDPDAAWEHALDHAGIPL